MNTSSSKARHCYNDVPDVYEIKHEDIGEAMVEAALLVKELEPLWLSINTGVADDGDYLLMVYLHS